MDILEEILFNIDFGYTEVDNQILASLLFEAMPSKGFESTEDFLPIIFEYLSDKEKDGEELDEELARLMTVINSSQSSSTLNITLTDCLELLRTYQKDANVIAILDVDGDWHPAKIVSYDLRTKIAVVQFTEYPSLIVERSEGKYHPDPAYIDESNSTESCYFCKREMKLSRHHLYPKEMHLKYIKKGFTRDYLMSNTLSICRPCHSAVHRAETNEMLASNFNTPESLITHPKIIKFVNYIKNKQF